MVSESFTFSIILITPHKLVTTRSHCSFVSVMLVPSRLSHLPTDGQGAVAPGANRLDEPGTAVGAAALAFECGFPQGRLRGARAVSADAQRCHRGAGCGGPRGQGVHRHRHGEFQPQHSDQVPAKMTHARSTAPTF